MSITNYRQDIDGLRTLAILPVVFNHAGLSIFPGGFVGVDVFFVISGFLITGILAREVDEERFSIVSFYERRIRRIFPALLSMLLACLAAGWFILLPTEFEDLSKTAIAVLLFASNISFYRMAGDYFSDRVTTAPLLHTWSLAVEEQFYLFFPLLLWLLATRLRHGWGWAILAISVVSLLLSVAFVASHPIANFYLLPTRIWELGIGALVAIRTVPASCSRPVNHAMSLLGIAMVLLSVVLINETMPFPGLTALPPCLGAAMIIWSGQNGETAGGKLLGTPVLVWFGLISYSLYLWHWPVLVGARIMTGHVELSTASALLCIGLSIALGWTSWRFIERPFRNARTGAWAPRRRIFIGAATSMVVVLVLAGLIFLNRGVPARLPKQEEAILVDAMFRSQLEKRCLSRKIGQAPCELGDTKASPDYVIWGDSHAGAMLVGFDRVLAAHGQSAVAFAKFACLPVPGLWRADRGPKHRCDETNADTLRQIEANYQGATVVLISRWALVTQSDRAPGEAGEAAVLARTGHAPPASNENTMLVREELDRLTARLTKAGFQVVILTSIPEQGRNVPKTFARFALFGQRPGKLAQGWITPTEYDIRNSKVAPIFKEVESRYGVKIINVRELMCKDFCTVRVGSKLLYRDDDHLSNFGAYWLVRQFYPALAAPTLKAKVVAGR